MPIIGGRDRSEETDIPADIGAYVGGAMDNVGTYTGPIQRGEGRGTDVGAYGAPSEGIGSVAEGRESYYGRDMTGGAPVGGAIGGTGISSSVTDAQRIGEQATDRQKKLGSSLVGSVVGNPLTNAVSGVVQGGLPGAVGGVLSPIVGALTSPLEAAKTINRVGGELRAGSGAYEAEERAEEAGAFNEGFSDNPVDQEAAFEAAHSATKGTGLIQGIVNDLASPFTGAPTLAEQQDMAINQNIQGQPGFGPQQPAAEKQQQDEIGKLESKLSELQRTDVQYSGKRRENTGLTSKNQREIQEVQRALATIQNKSTGIDVNTYGISNGEVRQANAALGEWVDSSGNIRQDNWARSGGGGGGGSYDAGGFGGSFGGGDPGGHGIL
jgi:hypothetical protein